MKVIVYIVIFLSFISCSDQGIYTKMKSNSDVYHQILKHRGIRENLKFLEKDLNNTEKIIFLGTNQYPISYSIYYDFTNRNKYFVSKYLFDKNSEYYKEPLSAKESQKFSTLLFALDYVLENKIEELNSISKEAYHYTTDTEFITIREIDVSDNTYNEYVVGSFEVYNGKPIMTEDEYWSIDWSVFSN